MWPELYPTSFSLFLMSGLVLLVGVWIDERRDVRACGEQQQRFDAVRAE